MYNVNSDCPLGDNSLLYHSATEVRKNSQTLISKYLSSTLLGKHNTNGIMIEKFNKIYSIIFILMKNTFIIAYKIIIFNIAISISSV